MRSRDSEQTIDIARTLVVITTRSWSGRDPGDRRGPVGACRDHRDHQLLAMKLQEDQHEH